jgi:hypothetical protein
LGIRDKHDFKYEVEFEEKMVVITMNSLAAANLEDFSVNQRSASSRRGRSPIGERLIERLLMLSAAVSILSILLITVFIFSKGVPLILKIGVGDFIFDMIWNLPTDILVSAPC